MGSPRAPGPLDSLSSRWRKTLPPRGQRSSAASSSWLKAWRKSWRTRGTTSTRIVLNFTRSSAAPFPTSTCWQRVQSIPSEGSAPWSHPRPKCPRMRLKRSSGVTLCWWRPGPIWTGWSLSLGNRVQRSKGKIRFNIKLFRRSPLLRSTWRAAGTSCNLCWWCRNSYSLWQLFIIVEILFNVYL